MEMSNRYVKVCFIAAIAFTLVFAANASVSAQTVTSASPTEVVPGPQSNLYKYLNHVPVTQYEWTQQEGNAEATRASAGPGPLESHALWVNDYGKLYEGLNQYGAVFNGKIIFCTDTSKSIYPGVCYAADQNTGKVLWSVPYTGGITKLDQTHMMVGTRCLDPETGSVQWIADSSISSYAPELKLGFSSGPSVGYAKTVRAWDFSDLSKKPVIKWTSQPYEDIIAWTYGEGKLFLTGLDYHMWAMDAVTGSELWTRQIASLSSRYHVGSPMYGNLYIQSHNGFWCYSQADGSLLWHSGLLDTGRFAVGFGRVVAEQTRTYVWCWDAYDGHVIWKYLPVRTIPHPCGPAAVGQCNHTSHHISFYSPAIGSNGLVYMTSMQKTTYGCMVPANWQGVEWPVGSGTYYWGNPFNVPATCHAGENEMAAINIYTGEVVWKLGYGWKYSGQVSVNPDKPAYEGPDFGQPIVADGKLYGIEQPYSSHTGVGTSRPELNPGITDPSLKGAFFKPLLANYWRMGRIYCVGAGPSLLQGSTDVAQVRAGEITTISGSLTDLSPASPGEAAPNVPVVLKWSLPDGSSGIINTIKTGSDGKFSYQWIPYTAGSYTITAESAGSGSYEAPDPVTMMLNVQPAVDLLPLLETALVVIIIVAVAVPIITYMRMRKQKV